MLAKPKHHDEREVLPGKPVPANPKFSGGEDSPLDAPESFHGPEGFLPGMQPIMTFGEEDEVAQSLHCERLSPEEFSTLEGVHVAFIRKWGPMLDAVCSASFFCRYRGPAQPSVAVVAVIQLDTLDASEFLPAIFDGVPVHIFDGIVQFTGVHDYEESVKAGHSVSTGDPAVYEKGFTIFGGVQAASKTYLLTAGHPFDLESLPDNGRVRSPCPPFSARNTALKDRVIAQVENSTSRIVFDLPIPPVEIGGFPGVHSWLRDFAIIPYQGNRLLSNQLCERPPEVYEPRSAGRHATALASQAAHHLSPLISAMDLTKRENRKRVHDDATLLAKVGMGSRWTDGLLCGIGAIHNFRRSPLQIPNDDAARLRQIKERILMGTTSNNTEKSLVLIFQSAVEGIDFTANHDSGAAIFVRSTGVVCGLQSSKFYVNKPGTLPMGFSAVIPWQVIVSEARNLGLDIHLM